jgi:hypothetical protein
MNPHPTNASQFGAVNALQKDIERLTKERDALSKERQDSQTLLLKDHSVTLADMKTTLDLLMERTKDLPETAKRVTRLESWKAFVAGIAAACTMIGSVIGVIVGLIFTRLK